MPGVPGDAVPLVRLTCSIYEANQAVLLDFLLYGTITSLACGDGAEALGAGTGAILAGTGPCFSH